MNFIMIRILFLTCLIGLSHKASAQIHTKQKPNICHEFLNLNKATSSLNTTNSSPLSPWILVSLMPDKPNVFYVPIQDLESYALGSNENGQLVYKESGQVITNSSSSPFLGIWDVKNQEPAEIYGSSESPLSGISFKHSSFNHNQPVLSAWILESSDGYITRVIDGSGHYQPNPFSIYLALKKFLSLGLNLESSIIEFNHGLEFIRGVRISAFDFIKAIESLSIFDRDSLKSINTNKAKLKSFLNLISKFTKDPFTIALIETHHLRNQVHLDKDKIEKILDIVNSGNISEIEKLIIIRGLYNSNSKFFKGKPQIKYQSETAQQTYYSHLNAFILDRTDDSVIIAFLNK